MERFGQVGGTATQNIISFLTRKRSTYKYRGWVYKYLQITSCNLQLVENNLAMVWGQLHRRVFFCQLSTFFVIKLLQSLNLIPLKISYWPKIVTTLSKVFLAFFFILNGMIQKRNDPLSILFKSALSDLSLSHIVGMVKNNIRMWNTRK